MDKNIKPKISVLLPAYNCRSYIEESVESILNQTFKDFEFIIIDDKSTDGTLEYLESLTDERVIIVKKPKNTGYTMSLNIGLLMARGKYIARMDGDDISLPDRFEKQVKLMDSNPNVILCGGRYQVIGSDLKFIPKTLNDDLIVDLIENSPIAHPTVFLRKDVLNNNKIMYDSEYEPAEDYKMWTLISEYGEMVNLPDILLLYRIHPNQTTNLRNITQRAKAKIVSFEYIKMLSKNNIYADYFCNKKLQCDEDVVKYDNVECAIKLTLRERDIRFNEGFFLERKKKYLQQSLYHGRYSIHQVIKDARFIFEYYHYLGNIYIIKHFYKSLIFWKSPSK